MGQSPIKLKESEIKTLQNFVDAQPTPVRITNQLPDAAFAVVERGGKKDEGGKTTPRNFRHLPHHNGNVSDPNEHSSIDRARLRNALARMNQIIASSPSDSTERIRRIARAHLIRHARSVLPTTQFR
jgi:hypothetical protein